MENWSRLDMVGGIKLVDAVLYKSFEAALISKTLFDKWVVGQVSNLLSW